jgi:glycine/D-amino acid oxidase-like deaminating enzyme
MDARNSFAPQGLPPTAYAETASAAAYAPAIEGRRRTQVAIIGGGYTGLSTALHLAEAGTPAMLLEAHEPGWGASGRNGGQVNPGLKPDPDKVEAKFGADLGGRMLALSSDAPNRVFELIERHDIACEALQSGTLRAAFNRHDAGKLRTTFDQWRRRGAPVDWLDRDAAALATGTDRYEAILRFRQGGKLNPLSYARGLAEAAQRAGAQIHGGSPALALSRSSEGWRIETPRSVVDADTMVIATNAYTGDLWPGLRRTIVPAYSGIAATAPLARERRAEILPSGSVLYEIGHNTVYYRLDRDGRLLMGGRSVLRDVTGPECLGQLIRYAERLWPSLSGVRWTHGRNGRVAITRDHYPHCHEPQPRVLICLGYNGRGIAMSTVMGALLARRILGEPPEQLPMPFTAIRPIRFHALWRPAAAIRLGYGAVRDALIA